jgi:hypothetical protein
MILLLPLAEAQVTSPASFNQPSGDRVMKPQKSSKSTILTVTALLFCSAAMLLPSEAEARHRRVIRYPSVYFGIGSPYYFGLFSPPYGAYPHGYRERVGGMNPGIARAVGIGGLDLNIKPRKAEVFVDGVYAGTVGDFDGYPSFLWMKEGDHVVTVYKGGFKTFEESFAIKAGVVYPVKLRLAEGQSDPPFTNEDQALFAPSALDLATSVAER